MRISRLTATAATLGLTVALVACTGSSGSGSQAIGNGSSGGAAAGHVQRGGTVGVAIGASPNFIFPLPPATNSDGWNTNLTTPMWPYLVYAGDGAKSAVNPQESLITSATYSDGDTKLT